MANVNNPHGFLPVRSVGGGIGQPKISYLDLLVTNAAIGIGDPVTLSSGDVDRAAASTALCGIAAESKSANTGGKIAVWADPLQCFEGQTDDGTGTGTTQLLTSGANANIVAGAPSNGRSIAEIDESTVLTTATLPLKIISLYKDPKNAYGEFNRLVVKINNHQFGTGTGTQTG